jgi:hypothetical protein
MSQQIVAGWTFSSRAMAQDEYPKAEARLLGTWPHGAVTVRSSADGLTVETHRTRMRLTVRRGRVAPGR